MASSRSSSKKIKLNRRFMRLSLCKAKAKSNFKEKIMKIKSIVISTVAVVAFSSFAFAQDVKPTENQDAAKQQKGSRKSDGKRGFGGEKGGKRHGKEMAMRGLHKLNLSDAQKEQMKSLHERAKLQSQPQRDEMKTLSGKKRDGIITNDEQSRLKELKTQMRENGKKMHEEMMSILTPEQKAEMEQKREEMRGKMKERRGNGRGNGEPKTETPKNN
jgi:periplasmic protein CpxP/Spy